jgi:hypothetical protein
VVGLLSMLHAVIIVATIMTREKEVALDLIWE